MAALSWLMNLGMAGSGVAVEAITVLGVHPRAGYSHRRKRPYGAWQSMFRRLDLGALLARRA